MSDGMEIAKRLRALTPARVGLGRSGVSQLTHDVLDFQLSHAQARDAVHARLDSAALAQAINLVISRFNSGTILPLHSAATDRTTYLQRPDLGRRLDESGRAALVAHAGGEVDLAMVIADGLSALAVERHVPPLLDRLVPRLAGRSMGPVCLVEQGRVAIGDDIGEALRARLSVVLIGERPGLSSPDSLGAYITWSPRVGRTDAERVCISNIRMKGLGYDEAAEQVERAVSEAFERRLTGVEPQAAVRALREVSET
jgi:ethanolamine ammonia-lyase small subunit